MKFSKSSALIAVVLFLSCAQCEIPSEVKKCHYADSSCLVASIQDVIKNFAKSGIRGINLLPFNPLHVNSLKLEKNPNSPVNIELKFKDIDFFGLQDAKVSKVRGFDADLKQNIEVDALLPHLVLKGPYEIDGRVLILPIVGKGQSEIMLENCHVMIKAKPKRVNKSGQVYLEVDAIKLELKPSRVTFTLGGLFNGMKELADNMHVFINENWEEIFTELQPDIAKALSLIVQHIVNTVFSKYPYEDYFLPN